MTVQHTPGPWTYKRTSGFDYGSTAYWLPGICTNVDTEANARLIAAAPELLEALKDAAQELAFLKSIGVQSSTIDAEIRKSRAAIAKATGEHYE